MNAKKGNFCLNTAAVIVLSMVLNFFFPICSIAQLHSINSISIVQHFTLPFQVVHPVFIHFSSLRFPDVLSYDVDSSTFFILKNDGFGKFERGKTIARSTAVSSITVGNVNNDGIDDIVIVHREGNQLEVLISKQSDSTYRQSFYPVNFYPEKATIGDLNNDNIPDIMSYGILSSGISFLQAKGNGQFYPVKSLFENISVSNVSLIAINGDNVIDIALHNWLSNETILYLGLGKLKFSEQTVLSFGEDSVHTLFSDFNNDQLADVAVTSTKDRTLQILEGDGLGNFSFSRALPMYHAPSRIEWGAFHTPSSTDIVLIDDQSKIFSLFLSESNGNFFDEMIFGTETMSSSILPGDINGDGLTDIILFSEHNNEYSICWNSQTDFVSNESEISFAVGLKPNNLYVQDLDGNSKDDLVITNYESATISVLMAGNKYFSGQISLETPDKPVAVSLYAKTDSTITLYSIHQENPKISLITLRKEIDTLSSLTGEVEQFSISLPEKPITVLPDVSYMEKGISLYAFMPSGTNSIVFYQQVKGTRFLTRSLVPIIPSKIIFSTINDLNNDGKTDLLYVYSNIDTQNNLLGITLNDSSGNFKGKVYSTVLTDSVIKRAIIYLEDVNGDQIKDCLLYTSPSNSLRLSLGKKDNTFEQFETILDSLSVKMTEQIQTYDFNNDGILDILFADKMSGELLLYRGKGNGKFYSSVTIADLPNDSVFRCGDFNGDNAADIAYTHPSGHTITLIYGNAH